MAKLEGAKHGTIRQKMMSFKLDLELVEWLDKQENKGRYINDLIRKDMTVSLEQEGGKDYVKIDRKVLFEICDAILNHYGYSDINDCPESDSECFWDKWNDDFRKKVESIRKNT